MVLLTHATWQRRQRGPLRSPLCLFVFPAAILVLFAAAAGAGIVRADLLFGDEYLGSLPLAEYLLALFFGKDEIPLGQLVKPGGLRLVHIEEELFVVYIEGDLGIVIDGIEVDLVPEARVYAVEEADEAGLIPLEAFRKGIEGAEIGGLVILQELLVELLFLIEILLPEELVFLLGAAGVLRQLLPIRINAHSYSLMLS